MTTPTELRSFLIQLSDNATRDLASLWSQLDQATAREGLRDVIPALVGDYADASATLSAEWYDEYRADRGAPGVYGADLAVPDLGVEALTGWGAGLALNNWDSALAQITGGLIARVMNASRSTITTNTFNDPMSMGWMRVGIPECGWCAMLISRGSVYRSQGTADFAAHDSCKCGAAPAWAPGDVVAVRNEFVPTARRRSEETTQADQNRAKAWIAANL